MTKLTTHRYSLFIILYSVFIIIYSMFLILRSANLILYSVFNIQYPPLTTHHSRLPTHLTLRVMYGRKLYREVLWSFELNRGLDTNFTFFKSKIHSNWHKQKKILNFKILNMKYRSSITSRLSLRVIFDRKLYREV